VLKATLRQVLMTYQQQGIHCNLLDVACGGGRYDLEVLRDFPQDTVTATLRDYKTENVAKARQLAQHMGMNARIEQADAFSDGDLNLVQLAPTWWWCLACMRFCPTMGCLPITFGSCIALWNLRERWFSRSNPAIPNWS
jgi:hypothetical protein